MIYNKLNLVRERHERKIVMTLLSLVFLTLICLGRES